ncbi:hypothetical protein FEM48_Zijuj11G0078400 [Ziziphus jujuba var. spinosa]|uniref:Uncharacterized protein n=1 Tax=Ziziphus jujuba var. spinosa TaxID=714518 RepID=A0A978UHQ8_ZIZJJ|nr:hypothetical protein FEM48_Zijuj11G0078400 [Ziziphus jujuba var. spinosa]
MQLQYFNAFDGGDLKLRHSKYKTFAKLDIGGVSQAIAVVQSKGDTQESQQQATVMDSSPRKINLISCGSLTRVSDIKLIRTDTTLDLSQKAEKGMPYDCRFDSFYRVKLQLLFSSLNDVGLGLLSCLVTRNSQTISHFNFLTDTYNDTAPVFVATC